MGRNRSNQSLMIFASRMPSSFSDFVSTTRPIYHATDDDSPSPGGEDERSSNQRSGKSTTGNVGYWLALTLIISPGEKKHSRPHLISNLTIQTAERAKYAETK